MKDPNGLVPFGESVSLGSVPGSSRNFASDGKSPPGVELASGKVAELVKSFEHVNEILDGFRYKMGAIEYFGRAALANETFAPVGQADWGRSQRAYPACRIICRFGPLVTQQMIRDFRLAKRDFFANYPTPCQVP